MIVVLTQTYQWVVMIDMHDEPYLCIKRCDPYQECVCSCFVCAAVRSMTIPEVSGAIIIYN